MGISSESPSNPHTQPPSAHSNLPSKPQPQPELEPESHPHPHQNPKSKSSSCSTMIHSSSTSHAQPSPALSSLIAHYDAKLCNFGQRYQRNNKRGGLKNLRCFPTCAEQHKERGFCGRSVVVRLEFPETHANPFLPQLDLRPGMACPAGYLCRAEFVKMDKPGLVSLGDTITLAKADALGRSKKEPTKPWVNGEFIAEKSQPGKATFEFNKDRKGWHYGWASNKHTCNAKHCLLTYVLEPISKDTLKCVHVVKSTPFMLFCRRRRRFVCVPNAPVSPPKKRKLAGNATPREKKMVKMELNSIKIEASTDDFLMLKNHPTKAKPRPVASQSRTAGLAKKQLDLDIARLEVILTGISNAISKMPHRIGHRHVEPLEVSPDTLRDIDLGQDDSLWAPEGDPLDSLNRDLNVSTSDLADFSNSIADCLDFFASSSGGGGGVDPLSSGGMLDYVDFFGEDAENVNGVSNFKRTEVIEDLAEYLLHETSFTKAMQKLNEKSGRDAGDRYAKFLCVLEKNLEGFMAKHSLTRAEFNEIFGVSEEEKRALEAQVRPEPSKPQGFFQNIYDSFVTLVSKGADTEDTTLRMPRSIIVNEKAIPNHSGRWVRSGEASAKMEEMRAIIGIPWLLGKMLDYMEASFEIEQEGITMSCRLRRKLLSNGTVKLLLDGKERPFGLKLPIMTTLSRNWTHRAFVNENTITIMHTFGKHRLTRISWLSADRETLHAYLILEVYEDAANAFVEKMRVRQDAYREG